MPRFEACSLTFLLQPAFVRAKFSLTTMSYRGRGRGRGRGRARYGRYPSARSYGNGGMSPSRDDYGASFVDQVHGDRFALALFLRNINEAAYPRYKDLRGTWNLSSNVSLVFDHIQSDPYASPSRARMRTPLSESGFPKELYSNRIRTTAFCDFLTRQFWRIAHETELDRRFAGHGWHGSKGGDITIDKPGQHVLERTSCLLVDDHIELRFTVSLPARGRSIQGELAAHSLTEVLPSVAQECLFSHGYNGEQLKQHVISVEDQEALRHSLAGIGLIAFVRNGAVLPRISGVDDVPLIGPGVVRFQSPPSLEVQIACPSGRVVKGMGIKGGITLVVGGGYHGKTTLLAALEVGVYNHIPGDGREFVAVHPDTASVRAEDGRSVAGVDITPFINNLPFGHDTSSFSSPDASGSTSQAANIVEALEAGAKVLLTDEDLAATNFMIRDQRMAELVPPEKEPITPMIHRIRALYEQEGVSSILAIGGAGDYFEVSDLVVMMDSYKPRDVTREAKKIAKRFPSGLDLDPANVVPDIFKPRCKRRVLPGSIQTVWAMGRGRVFSKVKTNIQFGSAEIDLSSVSQIVELSQTRAIAAALEKIGSMATLRRDGVAATVKKLCEDIDKDGLDAVNEKASKNGNYSRPRAIELQAALNRLRGIEIVEADW